MVKHIKPLRKSGIYLLPNLLTTIGMFAGFYAIVVAMKGQFEGAAIAIFVATIADGLDGRVARLTGTQSTFGGNYDSMADMLSFGMAPGLVLYSWSLHYLGKIGWLVAFWYTAATALRLARFNTQLDVPDHKSHSQGLTCTAAAAMIASSIWIGSIYRIGGQIVSIPVAILTIIVACLMVSNFRYYLFRQVALRGKVSFVTIVLTVVLVTSTAIDPPEILFSGLLIYVLSGPVLTYWQIRKMRHKRSSH